MSILGKKGRLLFAFGVSMALFLLAVGTLTGMVSLIAIGLATLAGLLAWNLKSHGDTGPTRSLTPPLKPSRWAYRWVCRLVILSMLTQMLPPPAHAQPAGWSNTPDRRSAATTPAQTSQLSSATQANQPQPAGAGVPSQGVSVAVYDPPATEAARFRQPIVPAPGGLLVDTFNGALLYSRTDLSIPGRGLPLEISLYYDSQKVDTESPVGYGWQLNYNLFYRISTPARLQQLRICPGDQGGGGGGGGSCTSPTTGISA